MENDATGNFPSQKFPAPVSIKKESYNRNASHYFEKIFPIPYSSNIPLGSTINKSNNSQ